MSLEPEEDLNLLFDNHRLQDELRVSVGSWVKYDGKPPKPKSPTGLYLVQGEGKGVGAKNMQSIWLCTYSDMFREYEHSKWGGQGIEPKYWAPIKEPKEE